MTLFRKLAFGLVLALANLAAGAQAETLAGRNIDSRFMLAFAADSERIGALLPDGWTAIGFPAGPLKGANFLIGLEERHLSVTPGGAPADPPRSRAAAVMALAQGEEGVRLYVLKVMTSDTGYDLFPDAVHATATRSSGFEGAQTGGRQSEKWGFALETGEGLDVAFEFEVGTGAWVSQEAQPYSASDPSVSRLFRYQQLVDVVMSEALGKPLSAGFEISSDLPGVAGILDGSERLVGILSIPVYIREVYLP